MSDCARVGGLIIHIHPFFFLMNSEKLNGMTSTRSRESLILNIRHFRKYRLCMNALDGYTIYFHMQTHKFRLTFSWYYFDLNTNSILLKWYRAIFKKRLKFLTCVFLAIRTSDSCLFVFLFPPFNLNPSNLKMRRRKNEWRKSLTVIIQPWIHTINRWLFPCPELWKRMLRVKD